jgi:hypothetical protein
VREGRSLSDAKRSSIASRAGDIARHRHYENVSSFTFSTLMSADPGLRTVQALCIFDLGHALRGA